MKPDFHGHPGKYFMAVAIKEAKLAKERGDYPFGAVIAKGSNILASTGDLSKTGIDPIGHCVMEVIRRACLKTGQKILNSGTVLYTTHEPCPMCATAVLWVKLNGLVFGSSMDDIDAYHFRQTNMNYLGQVINIPASGIIEKFPGPITLVKGFMKEECAELLAD